MLKIFIFTESKTERLFTAIFNLTPLIHCHELSCIINSLFIKKVEVTHIKSLYRKITKRADFVFLILNIGLMGKFVAFLLNLQIYFLIINKIGYILLHSSTI